MLEGWEQDKGNKHNPDELLNAYIKLYNDCFSRRPSDMHVGLHLCRGWFSGGWYERCLQR